MDDSLNILLLEDNPGDARLIAEMVRESNAPIHLINVPTLKDAKDLLAQQKFDLVLLDLSVPDSHGIETLYQIQAVAIDLPIIVLTGLEDENAGLQAVQKGAQDYLSKMDVGSRLLTRSIYYAIERNDIELSLRSREREYRSLIDDVFDTSTVAVLILNKEFKVVWVNEATETYFGIPRSQLIGRDKHELIANDLKCIFQDPETYAANLQNVYDKGTFATRFECKIVEGENRQERWLEHWSQPISDGIYSGGLIEQYMDITTRKGLETAEKEQRKFAEALSKISAILTSSLDLDDVLSKILNNLDLVIPHETASIVLLKNNELKEAQVLGYDSRRHDRKIYDHQIYKLFDLFADIMIRTGKPHIVADLQGESKIYSLAQDANIRSYLGAPIQFQNRIIGFINITSESKNFYSKIHANRLTAFAELAAVAIKNASLFEQSRELGQLQERQRLARELHDSVSQTLFSCHTMSESALRRWEKNPERTHELLETINQLTITALAEMRILLLELRPHHLTQIGLKQLFEQYLKPIQSRRGFDLDLHIDPIAVLPPDVQIAFYRITQEALNNIYKHALATHVVVSLAEDPQTIKLLIKDNGTGFDLSLLNGGNFGLNIMKERAEEINANFEISSEINRGTEISIIWHKT